jgi:hypothetical protein
VFESRASTLTLLTDVFHTNSQCIQAIVEILLWCICPLLGNDLVEKFPQHKRSIIERHPLLGKGPVSARSGQQQTSIASQ